MIPWNDSQDSNTVPMIPVIIRDISQDQPKEESPGVRSGKVPAAEPRRINVHDPPGTSIYGYPSGSLMEIVS